MFRPVLLPYSSSAILDPRVGCIINQTSPVGQSAAARIASLVHALTYPTMIFSIVLFISALVLEEVFFRRGNGFL